MTDTEKEALRLMASVIVDADSGKSTLPEPALQHMRDVVASAAPNCTPAQIANGECPGV